MYNPKLRRNLLSGSRLEKFRICYSGSKGKVNVHEKNKNFLFYAIRKNDLYFFKPSKYVTNCKGNDNSVNASANQVEKVNVNELWHQRLCHINNEYILNTSKKSFLPKKLTEDCISCKLAKSKRISFKSIGKIKSKLPLELLHMDLCRLLPVASHAGNRYFLSSIDDISRKVTVYTLKKKSDVCEIFLRFQKKAERLLNRKIDTV